MSSPSPKLEFVSTADASCRGSLRDVLLSAMPAKGGLWVPTHIPQIAPDFVERHRDASYADLAEAVVAVVSVAVRPCVALAVSLRVPVRPDELAGL